MTFKVRTHLRATYPCPVDEGGCGAPVGEPCTVKTGPRKGAPSVDSHAARWHAWDRERRGDRDAAQRRTARPGAIGLLTFLRDSYACAIAEGGCGALPGAPCRTRHGEVATTHCHSARWNALDRQVTANRPNLSVTSQALQATTGTLTSITAASRHLTSAQDLLVRVLQDLRSDT